MTDDELRAAIESLRRPSFSDDGGWWNAALDAVLAKMAPLRAPSESAEPRPGGDIERAVRWYFSASDDLTLAHILDAYAHASTPESE